MKTLIKLTMITLALGMSACASKPKGFELPPALSEVMRNGTLKGLEAADGPLLGMPNERDRVARTCRSQPIYSLEGLYVRTDISCY